MYRRLPLWGAQELQVPAATFPPDYCPWCEIWVDYFGELDPHTQHWVLHVDREFHIGIDLGDQFFSEVPLDIMERIAIALRAWSFSRRDMNSVLSSEIFRLIEDIIGDDRMLVLGPMPGAFGPKIRDGHGRVYPTIADLRVNQMSMIM